MISNKSLQKVQWLDVTIYVLLLIFFQMLIYGSVIMTLHSHFILSVKFIILIVIYGYCCWIVKHCSDIMFLTFRKISKRNELMRNPRVTSELSLPPKLGAQRPLPAARDTGFLKTMQKYLLCPLL